MTTFHLVSIFPEVFPAYFAAGVLGRGQKKGKLKFCFYDLRDFTQDKHRKVDDTPFGGGPGMVLKIEPIFEVLKKIKKDLKDQGVGEKEIRTILFSAKGKKFNQKKAQKMASFRHLIFICGRYEGVDERVAENLADEEISVGDFVLSGGEIPAMLVADAVSRLIPEVLGNQASLENESHDPRNGCWKKDYPVYTQPRIFNGWSAPEVLFSGDHQKINAWRESRRK